MKFGKRLISMLLAGAMALAMGAPAFAAANETVISGEYQNVTIAVTVPSTGDAVINPYKLPVSIGTSGGTEVEIAGHQILTKSLSVQSNAKFKLDVYATAVGVAKGEVELGSSKPSATEKDKVVYAFLQAKPAQTTAKTDAAIASAVLSEYAAWMNAGEATYNATTDILIKTEADKKKKICTLNEGDDPATPADTTDRKAGSIAMIRIAGFCAQEPETAWATTDGFDTTVAFTFTPNMAAPVTPAP